MRAFFIKAVVFLILIFSINRVIRKCYPYNWTTSDRCFAKKYLDYDLNYSNSNLLFFGSSKVAKHIAPYVFDSLLADSIEIRSYNLGCPRIAPSHSYHLLNHLLENKKASLKYLVIELERTRIPKTNRAYLAMTFPNYILDLQSIFHSRVDYSYVDFINLTLLLLQHYCNIGYIRQLEEKNIDSVEVYNGILYQRGFVSIDEKFRVEKSDRLTIRKKYEVAQVDRMVNMGNVQTENTTNPIDLSRINQMINHAKKQGVHMIFLLGPRTINDYYELRRIYDQIDEMHKIDLGNSDKFPELYAEELFWDSGHFNESGAILYTSLLAREFMDLKLKLKDTKNISAKPRR